MKKLSKVLICSLLCLVLTVSMSLTTTKAAYANTQTFSLAGTSSSDVHTITYTAPSKGYLTITAAGVGYSGDPTSASVKVNGFKDWEYLSPYTNNNTTFVGVKKGTYTIQLKGSQKINATVSFTKVKKTADKPSKNKAATIKKKKANKGLVVVDKKKPQWFKIKNPKNQKMTLVLDSTKMSYGNSFSSLKITVVFPNGKTDWTYFYPGSTKKIRVSYGPIGSKKAMKGTYYIKVQSQKGANGYYTLKWK
ncbi:MAG: hypothetical protein IKE52_05620 [Mogibacterium sp.]|nr:hypothetical protein [Mogibacterium sp.]